MKTFLQGIGDRSVGLVQIPCVCCVYRFTRFERWGKRILIIRHKFQFRDIRSMSFSHRITIMISGSDYLIRDPNSVI